MDTARWTRLQELFHAATALPPAERRAWLERADTTDPSLVDDVLQMLEEDAHGNHLLDAGVGTVVDAVLDTSTAAMAPDRFGPYRILRLLGEGGMGTVFLVRRDDLASLAALKVLRDAWPSPARRERFVTEQRILARLNHPFIAHFHDAGTVPDGTPWFVMEYVDGVPLTEYCRAHATSIEGRLELVRLACEGVRHAHQHGVIHRDLKPSNVLVTADGIVKLVDFGIAKPLEDPDASLARTGTGFRPMTPAYAAPEQVRGEEVGTHTDVYALGVMLWELLVGRLPFDIEGLDPADAATTIAAREPERPSVARRSRRREGEDPPQPRDQGSLAWADLDVLCLTAMHKDPARRYRTVDALLADLGRYLGGQPLEARADSLTYRAGKFVRRNRRVAAASGLIVAAVIGLTSFYAWRLAQARNTALMEAARAQRIQRFMLSLFEAGEREVAPAADLRVVTLVERGIKEARALETEPEVQAELLETLGGLTQQLGKLVEAQQLLEASLASRRSTGRGDDAGVGRTLVALGAVRSDQAAYDEAERLVRDGITMLRRHRPPEHAEIADATRTLGHVLRERGKYAEAIGVLQALTDQHPTSPDTAPTLHELATAHFYAGHYAEATAITTRALGFYRQLRGERHPLVAAALVDLGAAEFERGRYTEAERYYRESLDIVRAWYGTDHPTVAADLTMLGRALVYQKRPDEAVPLLAQAAAIRERVYGPDHPQVASVLNELGNIAVQQKQPEVAERHFARMVDIYRAAYHDKHYLIGTAQSNLASVYMSRGEYQRAETLFREAIQRFSDTLAPDHTYLAIARIKLGRCLLRQRKFADAVLETGAGYDILVLQSEPSTSFVTAARTDLEAAFMALGRNADANRIRAETARVEGRAR
jgi:serine/threonine-protein kinase